MMKKVIKKLLAALLAVAMVCAMAIPAFAFESWETEEDLNKNHGANTSLIMMIFWKN